MVQGSRDNVEVKQLDSELKKIKRRKLQALTKYLRKYGRKFDILKNLYTSSKLCNTNKEMGKRLHPTLPQER